MQSNARPMTENDRDRANAERAARWHGMVRDARALAAAHARALYGTDRVVEIESRPDVITYRDESGCTHVVVVSVGTFPHATHATLDRAAALVPEAATVAAWSVALVGRTCASITKTSPIQPEPRGH
jgi:hypothetical protein